MTFLVGIAFSIQIVQKRVTLMKQIQQLQVTNSAISSVEANQSVDFAQNTSKSI